jgi:hypothetical protein
MDAKTAWSRCFSQNLDVRLKISWATFIGAIKGGRGAIVLGWYNQIPYQYRGQKSPSNFGHAIYINEVRASDGALLMYDPLGTGPVWIPQIYVKRFAGAFRTSRGSLGFGWVQAGFTRVTGSTPAPAPKPTPAPTVTLRFKSTAVTPNLMAAKVASKQRRSPYIRPDNIIKVVPAGTKFRVYQKTTGTNVGGNTTWFGDNTGLVWMHSSLLKDI